MHDGSIAIEAKRLSKTLDSRIVLREIDLAVASGKLVAIVGANGSGKTTLLRCLSSRLQPSSGAVLWFGRSSVGDVSSRRLIGMVSHESSLYPHQTARENLLFAARMCDVARPHERVARLLQQSRLEWQANRSAGRMSRGTRQRVAILRALVHEPRILLLDEPSSGLDDDGTDWLVELLNERRDHGCAICVATHDDRLVEQFNDTVFRLDTGKLLEIHAKQGVNAGDSVGVRCA